MLKQIEYEQARAILLEQPVQRKTETVGINDALWQILAEDVCADFPMPPFDKSPFDGFVLRAEDTPGTLPVQGESAAGCQELKPLQPGTAMRIFTGAPIPEGADVVVRIEDTEAAGDSVTIRQKFRPGTNIIRTGEDYPAGACLLKEGTRLSAAEVGILASQGINLIPVFRKPKVLFLSTGSELAMPGEKRPRYGIFNSSFYSLSAYLRCMNFEVLNGGIVVDDRKLIEKKIADGLNGDADLVITTGGASVGDYDFAVRAAEDLGMEILFWKVRVKPGGALMAARSGQKLYLALSGNPAAAMMSLLTVLQPYLRKLSGSHLDNTEAELPLLYPLPKESSAVRMLRGREVIRDGVAWFQEHEGRGNGHIASFEHCSMIGVIPADSGMLPAGAKIKVLRLPEDLCC